MSMVQRIHDPSKPHYEGSSAFQLPLNVAFGDRGSLLELGTCEHGGFVREGNIGSVKDSIYRDVIFRLSHRLNPKVSLGFALSGGCLKWNEQGGNGCDKQGSLHFGQTTKADSRST